MVKNAAAAKGARPRTKQEQASEPLSAKRVMMLQALGLLVVLVIGGLIFFLWHQSYYFVSTDDAVVSGTTATAAASVAGTVATMNHGIGDSVNAGDTIATIKSSSGTTTKVTSPITGTIYNVAATQGEYVTAGETVAQVTVLSSLYVTAYVKENDVRQVHIGDGVDVTVGSASMHGNVSLIQPVTAGQNSALPTTDYASGNFTHVDQRVPVHIRIFSGNGHTIYPGMSANVTIHIHD